MVPVMALHQLDGYWDSEPGNFVSIYVNLDYVRYINHYGDDKYMVHIDGTGEPFIVTGDSITLASPQETFRKMAMEAALESLPDDEEGN